MLDPTLASHEIFIALLLQLPCLNFENKPLVVFLYDWSWWQRRRDTLQFVLWHGWQRWNWRDGHQSWQWEKKSVGNNLGCSGCGCYSKDVRYTEVSTAQLAALTRVSQNCEQFIKFECNNDVAFIQENSALWVSRDRIQINYRGGATGHDKMCACGVTNSCSNGKKCKVWLNLEKYQSFWNSVASILSKDLI